MDVTFISDIHHKWKKIKFPQRTSSDLLVICGDIGISDSKDLDQFQGWLGDQPFNDKIVIGGNWDSYIEQNPILFERTITPAIYLYDDLVRIDDRSIFGTPWIPQPSPSYRGAFVLAKNSKALTRVRQKIPFGLDLLVTHCPPYKVLDSGGLEHRPTGCELLRSRLIEAGQYGQPIRFHAFGHVHQCYGTFHGRRALRGTTFVNAALCDENYELKQKPIIIKI